MEKAVRAAHARDRLDERFAELRPVGKYAVPVRGWIRGIREALGLTTEQLAKRLGVKQPSVVAIEQSEARGTIELATLRRVAAAMNCTVVYALVPNEPLDKSIRDRARAFVSRRRGPVEHSMMLEDQKVSGSDGDARLDDVLRNTNPRMFWD